MSSHRLDRLPVELLQQIASHVPTSSILDLALVCRALHAVCQDWVVWQAVIDRDNQFQQKTGLLAGRNSDILQRYAVGSHRAVRIMEQQTIHRADLEWLPQLFAVGRKSLQSRGITMIH